jgi:hypothetical protein
MRAPIVGFASILSSRDRAAAAGARVTACRGRITKITLKTT